MYVGGGGNKYEIQSCTVHRREKEIERGGCFMVNDDIPLLT